MIRELLSMLFGDSKENCPNRQAIESVAPDDSKKSATEPTAKKSPDEILEEEISLLSKTYGPLTSGVKIELSLQEALQLFPRTRRRSDAYVKLSRKVHDEYGAELIITGKRKDEK